MNIEPPIKKEEAEKEAIQPIQPASAQEDILIHDEGEIASSESLIPEEMEKEIDISGQIFNKAELVKLGTKIFSQEAKIKQQNSVIIKKEANYTKLQLEIKDLQVLIQTLSDGESTWSIKHITFAPDEEIELPDGQKVKASKYIGSLTHEVKADASVGTLFHQGTRYQLLNEQEKQGPWGARYRFYYFETEFKGDGVLPEIKVCGTELKSVINESAIVNKESEIQIKEEQLTGLKSDIASEKKQLAFLEKSLQQLKKREAFFLK